MNDAPEQAEEQTPEGELPGEELADEDGPSVEAHPERPRTPLTSDRSLLLGETEDLAARHGLTVVLVAGEVDCGKTTLLVSIWNALLQDGVIGEAQFAGSRTALGFERRAWLSRWASGGSEPDTERTRERDNGFLHLRMRRHDRLYELICSDVAGETFKRIREGTPFASAVDWLGRTNHALFLVDGEAVADIARRSTALSSTRRLIAQLGKARVPAHVAVVLAKADCLDADVRPSWEAEAATLLDLARKVDEHAVLLETAARPGDGSEPRGLTDVIDRILWSAPRAVPPPGTPPRADRMIGRVR